MARKRKKAQEQVYDLTSETEQEHESEAKCMSAIVRKELVESYISFTPDELISGSEEGFGRYEIVLRTEGEYKRGELLMLDGNQYVKATSAGVANAESLVILAEDVSVTDSLYAEVAAYSSGRFMASAVILPYETEGDDHNELIAAIRPALMKAKIYLD